MAGVNVTKGVNVIGLKELDKQMQELIKAASPQKVQPLLLEASDKVVEAAKNNVHDGPTGNLKRAIKTKQMPTRRNDRPAPVIAAVDYNIAPHMHLVEFGHGGPHPAPAHPFFRPAWDSTKKEAKQIIIDGLKDNIEEVVRNGNRTSPID